MLKLVLPGREWFDEENEVFMKSEGGVLLLEHSLISLSKWESKWRVPFLDPKPPKTREQSIDYVRCMTIGPRVSDLDYYAISPELMGKVNNYIETPQTATFINRIQSPRPTVHEKVTSELIYYWMIENDIPFECQKWHLSRLLMLIDVCSFKRTPPNKMSRNELLKRNAALNKARCAKGHTRG